jgi:hypothetical protein
MAPSLPVPEKRTSTSTPRSGQALRFRIHAQRDRGTGAERRAEEFEWPGPGIFAAEYGAFVGAQLVMAGGYRHRVIRRAYRCACMRHCSLQKSNVLSNVGKFLALISQRSR